MIKNDIQTSTKLPRRIDTVPIEKRRYLVIMSNKGTHKISGGEYEAIKNSNSNFIELANGNLINKAFIAEILVDTLRTYSGEIIKEYGQVA